ncbi:BCD family MFS transporter [Cyanobium sp. N5-Cardenillas]|uniref:BCD family MFS transporter n=1 Tax=Cyanobium sp. N5-Cardenillas TaxID=2823720 RepID=UPI0020CC6D59|nr:BCD family MFS transporter [Cyanobium sp. N5-Cardenillas]MCP9784769.1 BCD family MFS transporter [Cyanobium sp. N5-Cardenillas]
MSTHLRSGLTLHATVRLGLFQGCLGCLAVIFSGLLNRIMLSELGFPGLLVGGALAFEQFVAPSRVLFGQISDAHPLASRHRVPYVLIGTAAFCLLAVLSVPLIFQVGRLLQDGSQPGLALGIAALCGLFALYGLAISLATTPYLALVIDRTSEQERPRAVSIIWCMLTVGIVIGAVSIGVSLRSLDGVSDPEVLQATLFRFMTIVAAAVMLLTVVATWGMESPLRERSDGTAPRREDAIGLRQSWTLITSSRQVLIFFSFLILFTLALFLQDPVLESYGAQVFAMPIAATAQLNAFWGVGTLVGLLLAGLWVVPRLGKMATARLGCQLIALSLLLLLVAGLTARIPFLQAVMVLFGLAAGIGTNSALCLMLDLTLPQAAGTFVGVWGLAQALSRAIGKLLGGGLYDIGRSLPLGDGPYGPFALVLGVELLVALAALVLLARVNVRQFREDTSRSLSHVLELELG